MAYYASIMLNAQNYTGIIERVANKKHHSRIGCQNDTTTLYLISHLWTDECVNSMKLLKTFEKASSNLSAASLSSGMILIDCVEFYPSESSVVADFYG